MATIAKSSITLVSISDAYSVSLQPSNITINADPYGNNPKLENAFTIISLYCGDIQVPISSANIVGSSLWEEGSNIHKQDYSLEIVGNSVKLSITSIGNQLSGWREIEVITNAGQKLTARFSYTVVRETTMLDWILEWDKNLTEISGDHVATPNAFIGNKDGDGKLTGVYIGGGENHPYLPGIYGFKGCTPEAFAQGNLGSTEIFHLNENGGMIGGWDISNTGLIKENSVGRLEILSEGTIRYVNLLDATNPFWELKSNGSGSFASGHITWDVNGNATFDGKLKAQSGEIGGWTIGSHSLYNTSILLDSANSFFGLRGPSGLMFITEPLSSSFYDSITRAGGIAIYYTDSTHYGLEGWLQGSPTTIDYNKGTQIFGLGSKNFIASWNIGVNALWRGDLVNTAGNFTGKSGDITIGSQGIRGYRWYIDADGEADFMQGRVHLGPSKCEIAGWTLTETMLKASNVALASGNNCSGLYLSHAALPTTGAASYAEYIRANGGIYLANLPSGPSLRGQNNDGKMTFQLTNGVCFIGGWWFSEECLFTGAKSTPTGEFATEGNITLSPDGLRGFKFRLEADGSGAIAGGNIWWEADGKVHFTDQVSLSWSNVTGKPNLTKIDANGIYTGTISADKITVGSISTDWIKNGIKWGLLIDGSGYLASKNIEWDKDGNINVKGSFSQDIHYAYKCDATVVSRNSDSGLEEAIVLKLKNQLYIATNACDPFDSEYVQYWSEQDNWPYQLHYLNYFTIILPTDPTFIGKEVKIYDCNYGPFSRQPMGWCTTTIKIENDASFSTKVSYESDFSKENLWKSITIRGGYASFVCIPVRSGGCTWICVDFYGALCEGVDAKGVEHDNMLT